jgi:hypothetical protein
VLVLVLVVVVKVMYKTEEGSYRNTLAVFRVGEDYATVSVMDDVIFDSRIYKNGRLGVQIFNYKTCD